MDYEYDIGTSHYTARTFGTRACKSEESLSRSENGFLQAQSRRDEIKLKEHIPEQVVMLKIINILTILRKKIKALNLQKIRLLFNIQHFK